MSVNEANQKGEKDLQLFTLGICRKYLNNLVTNKFIKYYFTIYI